MTQSEIMSEINALKNLLEQRDNDALEAIDELVVAVKECKSVLNLTSAIMQCLTQFYESAKERIALRARLRELIAMESDDEAQGEQIADESQGE